MKQNTNKQGSNNFKTAFKELTSSLIPDAQEPAPEASKNRTYNYANKDVKPDISSVEPVVKVVQKTLSIISAETKITGDVSTLGDITIEGTVCGNIKATGKISVVGTVTGNIEAANLTVSHGQITADTIKIEKDISISKSSQVTGSIHCVNISIDSSVTGNMLISNRCDIQVNSVINGNIQAKEISMESGAQLIGQIEIAKG